MDGWVELPYTTFNQVHGAGFTLRAVTQVDSTTQNFFFERAAHSAANPHLVLILVVTTGGKVTGIYGT